MPNERHSRKQFYFFLGVGLICTVLNYVLLYLLTTLLNIYYLISYLIVFFIGNLAGFILNKKYTFKTQKKHIWSELWKYYSVMFSNLLINLIAIYLLTEFCYIWYLHASLLTTIIGIFYNFILHKKWSFK